MKLLIVTHGEDLSCKRVMEEAEKQGIESRSILYSEVEGTELSDFDYCILRFPRGFEGIFRKTLERVLSVFGKDRLLDHGTYSRYPDFEDKVFQHELLGKRFKMSDYMHFKTPEEMSLEGFPVIVKKRVSGRCKGVFLIRSEEELSRFLADRDISDYIFERFLDVRDDIRIIVLGNRFVGSTRRRVYHKKREGYGSVGVKIDDAYDPPDDLKDKAVEVSRMMGCDFCGIDFVLDSSGDAFLIECNLFPEFVASERFLNKNIAGELVDFIRKGTDPRQT